MWCTGSGYAGPVHDENYKKLFLVLDERPVANDDLPEDNLMAVVVGLEQSAPRRTWYEWWTH